MYLICKFSIKELYLKCYVLIVYKFISLLQSFIYLLSFFLHNALPRGCSDINIYVWSMQLYIYVMQKVWMVKCLIKVFVQENSTSRIENEDKKWKCIVVVVCINVPLFQKMSQLLVFRMMDDKRFFPRGRCLVMYSFYICVCFTAFVNVTEKFTQILIRLEIDVSKTWRSFYIY